MLPAAPHDASRLAGVLSGCLDALQGRPSLLGLPRTRAAVVVVVDGLGLSALQALRGHARVLSAAAAGRSARLASGFPTTTAVALASLTTGAAPGAHGIVGYSVLDPARGMVVNQLTGWDEGMVPEAWQPVPTLFESATAAGIPAYAIGERRFADSGFTRAVLRGAEFVPADDVADRFAHARRILAGGEPALVYLYVAELDRIAHSRGWQSDRWLRELERVDALVGGLADSLRPDTGMIVTADHGMVDVPSDRHILLGARPELLDGIAHVAGEPRCLQLHVHEGVDADRLAETWSAAEGTRAWVATREQVIGSGWLGDQVGAAARVRMGDVFVAARKLVAYYADPDDPGRGMIGQHGSLTDEELRVPLARFGSFRAD